MANRLVPENLLAAVHQYLLSRPMGEVEGLVVALRQCSPQEVVEVQPQKKERKRKMDKERPANPHKPTDPGKPIQPEPAGTPPGGDPPPPPPPPGR